MNYYHVKISATQLVEAMELASTLPMGWASVGAVYEYASTNFNSIMGISPREREDVAHQLRKKHKCAHYGEMLACFITIQEQDVDHAMWLHLRIGQQIIGPRELCIHNLLRVNTGLN